MWFRKEDSLSEARRLAERTWLDDLVHGVSIFLLIYLGGHLLIALFYVIGFLHAWHQCGWDLLCL